MAAFLTPSAGTHAGDISEKFRFRARQGWTSSKYDSTGTWSEVKYDGHRIHMCCHTCRRKQAVVPCYHFECFRVGQSSLSPKLLGALAYNFDPPPLGERQREMLLKHRTVEGLRRAFPLVHLPVELWFKIAEPLIRQVAVAAVAQTELGDAQDPWQSPDDGLKIDLSRDVYASYVLFDGVRYIRALRNATEAEAAPGESLVLNPATDRVVDKVHIAFDHLGVRGVQFASADRVLPGADSVPGLWWRQLRQSDGISIIGTWSDVSAEHTFSASRLLFDNAKQGLKVRGIFGCDDTDDPGWEAGWSVRDPGSPAFLLYTVSASPFPPLSPLYLQSKLHVLLPDKLRMERLECNTPGITGYSVASKSDRVCMIHAHREGGLLPEYEWLTAKTLCNWVYMPINPGEYVTEIWLSPTRIRDDNKARGLTVSETLPARFAYVEPH